MLLKNSNEDEGLIQAQESYKLIDSKAKSNSVIQGISGIAGFPFNLGVDIAVIPTIYVPLWNQIREIYNLQKLNPEKMIPILKEILPEIFTDIALDKFLGSVPLVGVYFNAICAKTMTWRLGMLFTFLSSRTDEVPVKIVAKSMKLIRHLFPQSQMFKFVTPDNHKFCKLIVSDEQLTQNEFEKKIDDALKIFD